jgi:hypothetical protein
MDILNGSKKIIVLFSFLLLNVPSLSFSQENEIGGGVGGMFGVNMINMNDLNDEFLKEGLGSINPEKMFFGGLGYIIYNKFVLSPEGGVFWQTSNLEDVELKYNGGLGFLNFGYLILEEPNSRGYPFIGIGYGKSSMEFSGSFTPFEFGEHSIKNKDIVDFNTLLINLGFSVHFLINFSKNENRKGGIMAGLRAGYILTMGEKKWKIEGTEIKNGPNATFNGVYVRLMVGGWLSKLY